MADDDDEWTPSDSQAADSQASEAAPARRRLRKKGESQAALPSAASWEPEVTSPAAPSVPPVAAEPEAVCTSAIAAPAADEAAPVLAERATPATPTPALTPSRMDWARGFAASAGATLLGGLLRRFSLSPPPRAPPAAPSPVASPPLEEEPREAQPVQRRRLRKKRSLEAAASQLLPPDDVEEPSSPASPVADDGDALADALAGVTLAPTMARAVPPAPSPPAPPPIADAALPVAASPSSSSESSSDDSSSDDDASEDSSSDDDAPRPAPRPAPRAAQPATRDAAPRTGPLVAVGDDEAAAEGAAQPERLEFTDAATGARCVPLSPSK